ncbi:DUF4886 domain-containing protein [Acholeplasma granularum]|uniref:DUF4886 domain-containing protein n=1 Tax=Acholeplasma granularum TaxID=264635 RepID=UPI00046FB555|nr:DUF4886 domain-containing protein [Acholeplasma granularum]
MKKIIIIVTLVLASFILTMKINNVNYNIVQFEDSKIILNAVTPNAINPKTTGTEIPLDHTRSLKVLAIGNSFSDDALEYFWEIANDYGINEVVVGIAYMAGARLSHHIENIQSNPNAYIYRKEVNGGWVNKNDTSIEYALLDEDWDIVTIQQSSGYSGLSNSYQPDLSKLIEYIRTTTNNQNIRIYWHLTWAYQSTYSAAAFSWYDRNQLKMYNDIVNAVDTHIIPNEEIYGIIPAGTAIQNARTSFLGDNLTRDGYHLTYDLGRYAAALTWFHKLTGFSLDNISYRPKGVTILEKEVFAEAAYNAVKNPFKVLNSTYTSRIPDTTKYEKIQLDYQLGYWNPLSLEPKITSDDRFGKYYVTMSTRLTKDMLPEGSIISFNDEYKLKINLWSKSGSGKQSEFIRDKDILITSDIWQDFEYISFNFAADYGIINLTNKVIDVSNNINIYSPKR